MIGGMINASDPRKPRIISVMITVTARDRVQPRCSKSRHDRIEGGGEQQRAKDLQQHIGKFNHQPDQKNSDRDRHKGARRHFEPSAHDLLVVVVRR